MRPVGKRKDISPIHPGEILLEDFLKPMGLSMHRLAMDLHVPANRISQIVEGQRSISADTALRLSRYFGTTAELWLGLQMDFDLRWAREYRGEQIEREVQPRSVPKAA
ncbi:MAG: HigA family addiction module antitoxin [Candidatus Binataceae bacterium]